MASTSSSTGEKEPVHGRGQREPQPGDGGRGTSTAAIAADASIAAAAHGGAVGSPPPRPLPPTPVKSLFKEQPGDGFRGTDGSSSAAAVVDRKGKRPMSASDYLEQEVQRNAKNSSDKLLASSTRAFEGVTKKSSKAPRLPATSDHAADDALKAIDLAQNKKENTKSDIPKEKLHSDGHSKKKLSDKKLKQLDCPSQISGGSILKSSPHVDHKKIPIGEAMYHYLGVVDNTMGQSVIDFQMKWLGTYYSEFRQVHSDGECFYRSFIFSYLEQIVDRVDTREEDRLLAAVRKLASQATLLGWGYKFSSRCKEMHDNFTILAFETLIKKIKGWKSKRMWEYPTSIISNNRGKFLLKLFRNYDTANAIFAFLRLTTAIWILSHGRLYERRIIGLEEDFRLKDWCLTQIIPPHVHADDIAIGALCRALGVAVQVEDVISGSRIDVLGAEFQSALQVSNRTDGNFEDIFFIGRDTPRVTLVQLFSHYDILYPLPLGAIDPKRTSSDPAAEVSSAGADQTVRDSTAEQSAGSQQPSDPAAEASRGGADQTMRNSTAEQSSGSQQPSDPAAEDSVAETSSQRAVRWSCWCFLVPKKSPSRGSTGSDHSSR